MNLKAFSLGATLLTTTLAFSSFASAAHQRVSLDQNRKFIDAALSAMDSMTPVGCGENLYLMKLSIRHAVIVEIDASGSQPALVFSTKEGTLLGEERYVVRVTTDASLTKIERLELATEQLGNVKNHGTLLKPDVRKEFITLDTQSCKMQ